MLSRTGATGTPILILREGSRRSKGRDAQRSNIMAAKIVAEAIKTSLGPRGMDKMLVDSLGDVSITNDGHTILKEMDIQHPAAKMMVEVAKAQDDEVGDGTTTSVIIAGELLSKAEELIEKGIHPTVIIDGYRKAAERALEHLDKIAIKVDPEDKEYIKKVAETSMASKIVAENKEFLADIAATAVLQVAEETKDGYRVDIDDVKVEKKTGGSMVETKLIRGIVLDKDVVHPSMPRRVEKAKIALLNTPLEIKKTEFDSRIQIERPEQMEAFLRQEEMMLKEMVEKVASKGVKVLFCQKGIDDMAKHFLAVKGILATNRVKKSDMEKLSKSTGGKLITTLEDLTDDDFGYAELVEERKIGDDKMIFIEGCRNPRSVTILLRGGTERVIDEAERSIHDALCVCRDIIVEPRIVAGGGASELEVSRELREYAESLPGREQLAVMAYAEAFESIPTTLAENAGLDPIDVLSELRAHHEKGERWAGIDVNDGKVKDMEKEGVLEPLIVKKQVIKSATEAASMILKIDDVIAVGRMKSTEQPQTPTPGYGGYPYS